MDLIREYVGHWQVQASGLDLQERRGRTVDPFRRNGPDTRIRGPLAGPGQRPGPTGTPCRTVGPFRRNGPDTRIRWPLPGLGRRRGRIESSIPEPCHDTTRTRAGGTESPRSRSHADRFRRASLVGHRGDRLRQAAQGARAAPSDRSASTTRSSSWRSSTTTCSTGSTSTRSSWAGDLPWRTSTGPTGRCPTARRARCRVWALPERQEGEWVSANDSGRIVARMPDGAIYFEQCYWPYLEHDDLDRLPEALSENMWCAMPEPAGPAGGRARTGSARLAEGARRLRAADRPGDHRPLRRQPVGDRASSSTASTTSSCSWPAIRLGPTSFSTASSRCTWRTWSVFWPPSGRTSTSSCSATIWACRTARRCRRRCTEEFFKPRHARMWRRAKELADVKVMLHCCGGVRPLLPDLIEAGLDAINPVQITCTGMDAARAEAGFRQRI